MYSTTINITGYTTIVVAIVITAFKARALVNFESEGPKRARKVLQNTRVYVIASIVLMRRICPKRVNNSIVVKSSGMVAKIVVMAELAIETPTNETDAATRLTRMEAPDMNCDQGKNN